MTTISIGDKANGASKLLGLELLRFACAMMVLVYHHKHFAMVGTASTIAPGVLPLEQELSLIYAFGLYGVQIFWCISGFIFYWKYADALAARRVEPKKFFWLRFSRLYPLHIVTLLIVAALQPLYAAFAGQAFVYGENGVTSFVLQLFLGDQWGASRSLSFNGPIWSVSAEVLVYLAFFLLVRAFGKSPWLIVGAIGASLWSMWSGNISPALVCAGYFFAGGAAAEGLRSKQFARRPDLARSLAMAIVIACLLVAATGYLAQSDDHLASWLMIVIPPLLFLCAQDFPALDRWQRPIQAAGNLTYSTYLIHFPLQLAVATFAVTSGIVLPIAEAWFLLAYLATTIVIGRIVFLRFEAPVQNWIRSATLTPKRERVAA